MTSVLVNTQVNYSGGEVSSAIQDYEHHCRYNWFIWNNNSCKCGPISGHEHPWIRCNQETHELSIHKLTCMTYGNITGSTTAGYCPFSIYPRSALTSICPPPIITNQTECSNMWNGKPRWITLFPVQTWLRTSSAFIWIQMCKVFQYTLWLVSVFLCGIFTNNFLLYSCCPVPSPHHLCSAELFCLCLSSDFC